MAQRSQNHWVFLRPFMPTMLGVDSPRSPAPAVPFDTVTVDGKPCRKTGGWVIKVVSLFYNTLLTKVLYPKEVDLEKADTSAVRVVRVER